MSFSKRLCAPCLASANLSSLKSSISSLYARVNDAAAGPFCSMVSLMRKGGWNAVDVGSGKSGCYYVAPIVSLRHVTTVGQGCLPETQTYVTRRPRTRQRSRGLGIRSHVLQSSLNCKQVTQYYSVNLERAINAVHKHPTGAEADKTW